MTIKLSGKKYDLKLKVRKAVIVSLFHHGRKVGEGEAVCCPPDQFDLRYGRDLALSRLVEKVWPQCPEYYMRLIMAKLQVRGIEKEIKAAQDSAHQQNADAATASGPSKAQRLIEIQELGLGRIRSEWSRFSRNSILTLSPGCASRFNISLLTSRSPRCAPMRRNGWIGSSQSPLGH